MGKGLDDFKLQYEEHVQDKPAKKEFVKKSIKNILVNSRRDELNNILFNSHRQLRKINQRIIRYLKR